MIADPHPRSTPSGRKLRIGVILDALDPTPFQSQVIESVAAAPFAEFVLVILPANAGSMPRQRKSLWNPLIGLYQYLDRKMHHKPSERSGRATAILNQLPRFELNGADADLASLGALKLDVLLALGLPEYRDRLVHSARYGVWAYRYGQGGEYESGAYFPEMLANAEMLTIALHGWHAHAVQGVVLGRAVVNRMSHTSQVRNKVAPFSLGPGFAVTALRRLSEGEIEFARPPQNSEPGAEEEGVQGRNADLPGVLRDITRNVLRRVRRRSSAGPSCPIWRIGLRMNETREGVAAASSADGYKWTIPPPGRCHADPFLMEKDGHAYVFFEDMCAGTGVGRIACAEIFSDGSLGPATPIIEPGYHTSYPMPFAVDGEIFMIPETGANKTVELFRATSFPFKWQRERILFRGPAFDTTVLVHEARFWFFVSLNSEPLSSSPQLFLFHAERLTDDWTMHPASPISQDIRTARCGGGFFRSAGHLIRVAQDGSRAYGRALRFLQIDRVNTTEYRERLVGGLQPHAFEGLNGVHTYNRCGRIEVIDGRP